MVKEPWELVNTVGGVIFTMFLIPLLGLLTDGMTVSEQLCGTQRVDGRASFL